MRLKIAITSTVSWPYVRRGSRITYELAVYLAKQGHEVHYISTKPGSVSRKKLVDGVHTEYHRLIEHPLLTISRVQKFDTFTLSCLGSLLRDDYDIVQTTFPMDAFAASVYRSIRGTPFVHYMFDRFYPRYYITSYGKLVFNRCIRTTSGVGVISNFIRNDLKEKFGIEGVVIPGTVDIEQFTPSNEKYSGAPYILSTSSLIEPRKRVPLLVKAFERLLDHVPDAGLKLSGHTTPEMTRALLDSVSPEKRKAIEILGVGRREDLPRLYQNAALTVLPSVHEAFGLVILESLASGTPVAGTRSGGIPDILNDPGTGVLFEEGDGPEEVCKVLLKGLELNRDPGTKMRCRSHAEQYSWNNVGPLYEKLYFDTLAGRQQGKITKNRNRKDDPTDHQHTEKRVGTSYDISAHRALSSFFDDALDELDIDYDRYYKIDLYRPGCVFILAWLLKNGYRKGNVLVVGANTFPLKTLLERYGFTVLEVETCEGSGNGMFSQDPHALKEPRVNHDVIICDGCFNHAENPGRILKILRDHLTDEGIFIFITQNRSGSRSSLHPLNGTKAHSGKSNPVGMPSDDAARQAADFGIYDDVAAVRMLTENGFSVTQSDYMIKEKPIEGSLFPPPVRTYFQKNLSHFLQKAIPRLRGHIFIAAKKRYAS